MRQLEEASNRLYGQKLAELNARSLFQSVRVAWAEEVTEGKTIQQRFISTRKQVQKAIKAVITFGIFPVIVWALLGNLVGKARSFRPHGAALIILSIYGIIFPSLVICRNRKIRLFVVKLLRDTVFKL